jgi:hypothetical protein
MRPLPPQRYNIHIHTLVQSNPIQSSPNQLTPPSPPSITLARSTRTVRRHTVSPIRITLPNNHTPILRLDQILVLHRLARGQTNADKPQRIAASVLGGAESHSLCSVPVSECRDAADDVDRLAEVGRAAFVEGHGCEGRGRARAGAGG